MFYEIKCICNLTFIQFDKIYRYK